MPRDLGQPWRRTAGRAPSGCGAGSPAEPSSQYQRGFASRIDTSSARQREPHVRAAGRAIPQARAAAVGARHELDDRKTEPRAAAATSLVGAAESVECACSEVVRKARAGIPDMQLDEPVSFLRGELYGSFSVHEGVVDEV